MLTSPPGWSRRRWSSPGGAGLRIGRRLGFRPAARPLGHQEPASSPCPSGWSRAARRWVGVDLPEPERAVMRGDLVGHEAQGVSRPVHEYVPPGPSTRVPALRRQSSSLGRWAGRASCISAISKRAELLDLARVHGTRRHRPRNRLTLLDVGLAVNRDSITCASRSPSGAWRPRD